MILKIKNKKIIPSEKLSRDDFQKIKNKKFKRQFKKKTKKKKK